MILTAFNKSVSLLIRVCMTLTSAKINFKEEALRTIEELILLTEDTSDTIHEIATQSEGERFISV